MRLNRRRGVVVATLGLATVAWSGCSGKKATELVAGVSSQVQVPRDMRTVVVNVNSASGQVFCQPYPVYDGKVRLPRTLGVVSQGGNLGTPVTITVAGYTQDVGDTSIGAFQICAPPAVGVKSHTVDSGGGARVLRRSRQTYSQDRIVYVPMPLRFSCYDADCEQSTDKACSAGDCTCKGGQCVLPDVDSAQLPDYDDGLVFGTSNTCFRPFQGKDDKGTALPGCLDFGLPPQVVDATKCIYALPGTASVPANATPYDPNVPPQLIQAANSGGGLNVRVVFDNIVSEVLDFDGPCPATGPAPGAEGYCTFPDAPQKFQLGPGLCDMANAAPGALHTISLMTAAATCPSKTLYQPVCDDAVQGAPQPTFIDGGSSTDGGCNVAIPLKPAPSALYVLWDKSSGMRDFFGKPAVSNVLSLSLSDPVFKQTQLGFKYMPGIQGDCTAAPNQNSFAKLDPTKGDIPFEPSAQAQLAVANSLLNTDTTNLPAGTSPFYLEAALDGAYTALKAERANGKQAFNRLAAMLFFDRDFQNDCGGTHASAQAFAQAAFDNDQIETYVVFLKNADFTANDGGGTPPAQAALDASQLAHGFSGKFFFDASQGDPAPVQADALASVVADLGSCKYEVPAPIGTLANISFPDLTTGAFLNVAYGASCTGDSQATPRWVFDSQQIRLCDYACSHLVSSIKYDQALTAQTNVTRTNQGLPPIAVAGIAVSATQPCDPSSAAPPIVEAGATTGGSTGDASTSADGG